jgi:mRNA interferase MazF
VRRGDVVIVVIPGDLGKPRPAVVVQADELGDKTKTILVCPMSSEIAGTLLLRPIVEPSAANGLRVRSQIMTDKLIALDRRRIRQSVGALERDASERLDRALLLVLGLTR